MIGFSRLSIIVSLLFFTPFFIYSRKKFIKTISYFAKEHGRALALSTFVLIAFMVSLYFGIFRKVDGYIVMSSVNWQDTAMHMGIIESIANGNFPPQAPYYSGVKLSYYYFSDFNAAIITKLFAGFFPKVLVLVNPIFAFVFSISSYCLAYYLTRNRKISLATSFTSSFFSSFIFVNFLGEVAKNFLQNDSLGRLISVLSSNSFSMEYGKLFQMANFADYFLQNRPMMVGISATVTICLLFVYAFQKRNLKTIFLSSFLSGLLVKFQLFSVLVLSLIFLALWIVNFDRKNAKFFLKSIFIYIFTLLALFLVLFQKVNNSLLFIIVKENFHFGGWDDGKNILWYIEFALANFGICISASFLSFVIYSYRLICGRKVDMNLLILSFLSLVFFLLPFFMRFTIYSGDMFKFFYFAVIFAMPLVFNAIVKIAPYLNSVFVANFILYTAIFVSSFSSILTLTNSILNENYAYSASDLDVGDWIRTFTPPKSVFVAYPTVHTPITQIAGRLRVLSYINWPYSHGYNSGDDNVFARLSDIKTFYTTGSKDRAYSILAKYRVDYVYYGSDEKNEFSDREDFFSSLDFLSKVYENDQVEIFKVIR